MTDEDMSPKIAAEVATARAHFAAEAAPSGLQARLDADFDAFALDQTSPRGLRQHPTRGMAQRMPWVFAGAVAILLLSTGLWQSGAPKVVPAATEFALREGSAMTPGVAASVTRAPKPIGLTSQTSDLARLSAVRLRVPTNPYPGSFTSLRRPRDRG